MFRGYKLVRQFSIPVATVCHIWLARKLCGTLCFLLRLPSPTNSFLPRGAAGSRIMRTVSTGTLFYGSVILAGSRFTQKLKQMDSLGRKENWRTTLYSVSFVICRIKTKTVNVDTALSHFRMPTRPFDTVLKNIQTKSFVSFGRFVMQREHNKL